VTLTRKLFLSYVALVMASSAVLVAGADLLLRSRLTREAGTELEREVRYLAAAVTAERGARLDSAVVSIARTTGRRLTVIDTTGQVLADSDFPDSVLAALEDHRDRPEFHSAFAGRIGRDFRRSTSTGRWEFKVAAPIPGGAVRVSASVPQVDAVVRQAQTAVLLGALLAVVVAAFLAFGFARRVTRPLVRLRDAAQGITRGERPVVDTRGGDEVADLARALRSLEESLAERIGALERERSETAALVTAMVEGVVACDARGAVVMCNPAARRMLGFRPDEPLPLLPETFRQRAAQEAVVAALAGTTTQGLEVEFDRRRILLSAQPLQGGGAVFVLHDLTAVRRLEAVRRDFVANVSHELKTPLTVVRGYAETLLGDEPAPEVRRTFLASILANAARMQRLVDDLLDLSRIESGAWTPRPERVALKPLAEQVWSDVVRASNAADRAFTLAFAPDAGEVEADPQAVRQVLANILENAARYTPAGGSVTVRSRLRDGAVVIEVADTGPGIPNEHLPRIFERFYRVDAARSRELGGTGLGLAIVKHLVEAHGGRVEAESRVGDGTTIRVSFPAAAPAVAAAG
jgi:two-component system phosphate regulon sensor histidine kinase PhoR